MLGAPSISDSHPYRITSTKWRINTVVSPDDDAGTPCIPDSNPYRITSTNCCINTILSPDDGHIVARNMYRKEINILRKIVHQVGSI